MAFLGDLVVFLCFCGVIYYLFIIYLLFIYYLFIIYLVLLFIILYMNSINVCVCPIALQHATPFEQIALEICGFHQNVRNLSCA